jgi:hypothetical protein
MFTVPQGAQSKNLNLKLTEPEIYTWTTQDSGASVTVTFEYYDLIDKDTWAIYYTEGNSAKWKIFYAEEYNNGPKGSLEVYNEETGALSLSWVWTKDSTGKVIMVFL